MKKVWTIIFLLALIITAAFIWDRSVTEQNTVIQENIVERESDLNSAGDGSTQLSKNCNGDPLPFLTEGPYYKAGSPQRRVIREENTPSVKLTLEGYVFDTNCKPVSGAWIDFWQADGNGNYDSNGYILRGHQYTDKDGRYRLETVVPGLYPGRTEHIHFKIRASNNSPLVTSQLFLPGSTLNSSDSIFDEALVVSMTDRNGGKHATYNFVVNSN